MKKYLKYRAGVVTFFSALIIVGLLNAVAPKATYSDRENRELAKMPAFSWASLADGSYLSGFQTYFSDTFLGRDWLFDFASTIKSWYGLIGEEDEIIIETNPNNSVDEGIAQGGSSTPTASEEAPSSQPSSSKEPSGSSQITSSEAPSSQVSSEPPVSSMQEPPREEDGQTVNGLVVGTQTVFQLYGYFEKVNNRYAAAVSNFADKYPNITTHCMVVPINTAFYLPEKYLSKTSDEKESIQKIYAAMSDKVHTVDAYSKLEQHANEYIYFRTDHHWTQLGAYYGYSAFTESLGNTPFDLNEWRTVEYPNFLGSLYSKVRENAAAAKRLENNADTLTAWIPAYEYKLLYYPDNSITKPASYHGKGTLVSETYKGSNKYMCFIHGDQPMEVIENYDNSNGKTLMIFKESYGNAFVPLVCNDFERVIVIDPRYFKCSLSELMTLYDVTDALFLNYILAPGTSQRVNEIEKIVNS